MPKEREVSALWIIPISIILGVGAGMGLLYTIARAAPSVKYRISYVGNEPLGAGGIRFVQPDEYQSSFNEGDTVIYEAVPRDGYQFAGWLLDEVPWSTDNPLTFTMNPTTMAPEVSHSIVATYVPV